MFALMHVVIIHGTLHMEHTLFPYLFPMVCTYYLSYHVIFERLTNLINTQYATDSYFVYVLKMEYVTKINIFGFKMMVKNGLEKIFLKFLHRKAIFGNFFVTYL